MQHARGPVPGRDMDQGAKAPGGLAAGCSTISIPGMGPPAGSGDKSGCGQREQHISARPVPNLHQPRTMTMTMVEIKR